MISSRPISLGQIEGGGGSSKKYHFQDIPIDNNNYGTLSTWFGKVRNSANYDSETLFNVSLAGSPLSNEVWKGYKYPNNSKFISANFHFQGAPSSGSGVIRILLIKKDHPNNTDSALILNYETIADVTTSTLSISAGIMLNIPLTINTHTASTSDTMFFWAFQLVSGTPIIQRVGFSYETLEQ